MKKRKGFVANSSSASYVVKIAISEERLFDDILSHMGWSYFSASKVIAELEEDIAQCEESISKYQEQVGDIDVKAEAEKGIPAEGLSQEKAHNRFRCQWILRDQKRIEKLNALKVKLEKYGTSDIDYSMVRELLIDRYGVNLFAKENSVTMTYFTPMHNSYEDLSPVMREMVLYYEMETDIRPKCRIEDDMFDNFNEEEVLSSCLKPIETYKNLEKNL